MILIDALYIHNSGGKTLLISLIKELLNHKNRKFWFLLDSRLDKTIVDSLATNQKTILVASEFKRRRFYLIKQKLFTSIFCFANVPPPIKINKKVIIYFQNDLILNSNKGDLDLKSKFIIYIKKVYIKQRSKKHYHWAVQTSLMKEKLSTSLSLSSNKIKVLPFYEPLSRKSIHVPRNNTFIYVAGDHTHKNHQRLVFGFNLAARSADTALTLNLTLTDEFFFSLKQQLPELHPNFKLVNLGVLTKNEVIEHYLNNRFCIYPSLKESFGLPLIEAAQLGLEIVASDLLYVHQVVSPLLCFNPYDVEDIAAIVLKAVNLNNTRTTTLKISNELKALTNLISNDI